MKRVFSGLLAFALALLPAAAQRFDAAHIVASFGVISDVHIDSPDNATAAKFVSALEQLRDTAAEQDRDGLDAVLVAGDLINNAYSNPKNYVQVDWFRQLYESVFDPVKLPLVYTPGNHDVYREWTADAIAQARNISSRLGSDYFLTDLDQDARESMECRHCVVNGMHVLCILPVGRNPVVYTDAQKAWLDATLASITARDPHKYVIILSHPMVTGTVYGSDLGDYWATSDLNSVLEKYPQAVIFGGHLHFPLNDPRSIWQGSFTACGTASVRYMAIEPGAYARMSSKTVMKDAYEYSEGLLLQVDRRGNVRLTRMDFYRKACIGKPWILQRPDRKGRNLNSYRHESMKAANKAPVLSGLSWSRAEDGMVSACFQAGSDDEFVHHYVLTLSSADGTELMVKKVLADFYRAPQPSDMKKAWTEELMKLAPGSYRLSLVAFDSWDAASNGLSCEIAL